MGSGVSYINSRVERLVHDAILDMHGATVHEIDKRLPRHRRDVVEAAVKALVKRGDIMAAGTTADIDRTGGEREPVDVYVMVEFEGAA